MCRGFATHHLYSYHLKENRVDLLQKTFQASEMFMKIKQLASSYARYYIFVLFPIEMIHKSLKSRIRCWKYEMPLAVF